MKTMVRSLLVLVTLLVVGAGISSAAPAAAAPTKAAPAAKPAAPAANNDSNAVVHVWQCEMSEGTTEEQVDLIAQSWMKAIRQMPGGAAAKVQVLWPVAVSNTGGTDFQFVVVSPSFTDWGKFWDAYTDESEAGKADELNQGKVECPDSALWEAHDIGAE